MTILGVFLRERGALTWSGGMVRVLGDLGVSEDGARAALNRLAQRDLIVRTRRGRRVFYALTPRSEALLAEGDQRIFNFGRTTEDIARWTVLWHSLPDDLRSERTALSRRLRFLGFGLMQDATWLAPHDREQEVVNLLQGLGVAEHACVLVGRLADGLDGTAVLGEAWNLDEVHRGYERFVAEFGPFEGKTRQRDMDDREAFVVLTKATHQFRQFPLLDPELPDALMPTPAVRPHAIATFHALRDGLSTSAERYFAQHCFV